MLAARSCWIWSNVAEILDMEYAPPLFVLQQFWHHFLKFRNNFRKLKRSVTCDLNMNHWQLLQSDCTSTEHQTVNYVGLDLSWPGRWNAFSNSVCSIIILRYLQTIKHWKTRGTELSSGYRHRHLYSFAICLDSYNKYMQNTRANELVCQTLLSFQTVNAPPIYSGSLQ